MTEVKLNKIQRRNLAEVINLRDDEDDADHVVRVRVTRESVDAHRTVFNVRGMDLSPIKKNPAVFLGHNDRLSAQNLSVARIENLERGQDDSGVPVIDGDLVFDRDDELAMIVARKMRDGFLSGVSIKAQINPDEVERTDEGILIFNESSLLGLDLVGRGSNQDATALRSLGLEDKEIEIFLQREIKDLRSEIAELRSLLEEPAKEPESKDYLDELVAQIPRDDAWLEGFEF